MMNHITPRDHKDSDVLRGSTSLLLAVFGAMTLGLAGAADNTGNRITYHENHQMIISNLDGSDKRRIETGNPFNFLPQWSPDGEWLLFGSMWNSATSGCRRNRRISTQGDL